MTERGSKLRILLFGGSGLVGSSIKQLLATKFQIIVPTRLQLDVTTKRQVEKILISLRPDYIIYSVGLTSVDQAEENPKLAYLLNNEAPTFLAEKASFLGIPLLYFSTDAVFDGTNDSHPYQEIDKPNPQSIYGKSKLLGEQNVLQNSNRNCVARIIMPYSFFPSNRENFVQIAIKALGKGEQFYGITDQIINPIYIGDLVNAIYLLITSGSSGIYHLAAKDYVTNYEFIKKIAKIFNFDEQLVKAISFEDFFKKKAPRGKFCWLDTTKFTKKFGKEILNSIDQGLKLFKESLNFEKYSQSY